MMAEAAVAELPPPACTAAEMRMLRKVIASDHVIKNQQRGEPDLTEAQKIDILTSTLRQKTATFLMRFGPLLDDTDLKYFEGSEDFEITTRVKELKKNIASRQKRVRNRRFECIKELTETTNYFSDEEMRNRNPLLFEHYIGQYLTEDERAALDTNRTEMSLSALMMKTMDMDQRAGLLKRQKEREAEQIEENDSSSEEEEDGKETGLKLSRDLEVAAEEKRMLRQEYLRVMHLSFLSGGDEEVFDYSKVDTNDKYDSMDQRQQDEEDVYFDTEEPSWCEEDNGMELGTGDMGTGQGTELDDYMLDEYR